MTRITIPDAIIQQVRAAIGPIEFVDANGVTIATASQPVSDCPHSEEELDQIRKEPGRPLAEIWKTLGVK